MTKKWTIICIICIIVGVIFVNKPQRPKLVSSITTMDCAYLTILVDKKDAKDLEKLETNILKMCKENTFENIKLGTEARGSVQQWHISVYSSQKDLEEGNACLTITYKGDIFQ